MSKKTVSGGLGEGLKGLVAELQAHADRTYAPGGSGHEEFEKGLRTAYLIAAGMVQKLAALEATAPAGTPAFNKEEIDVLVQGFSGDTGWLTAQLNKLMEVKRADRPSRTSVSSGDASMSAAALATPSPQAPAEPMCECTRGLDGTLVTMNCERHKRLVVLAATQEQPAGSGALREALERIDGPHLCQTCGHRRGEHAFDLVGEHFCEHDEGVGTDCCKCQNYVGVVPPSYAELVIVLRALSLSSLPESAARINAAMVKALVQDAAMIYHIGSDAYFAWLAEQLNRNIAHATSLDPRKAGSEVREASSEIRERIEALPVINTGGIDGPFYVRKSDVLEALAPSRKGAAKRVEG